ncbi:MAG TPA: translation initiation factor IF-6 [Candidatus Methanomethylophilaceae archaeon]|nr:translation initiation factor IF-6 [Candidatus Methanomethylophilaceae archaeon]
MMRLSRYGGNSNIGVYAATGESLAIVAGDAEPDFIRDLEIILGVETILTTVAGSFVVGSLTAMNSNGIALSGLAEKEEILCIKEKFENVTTVPGRYNAAGNNILVNDHGSIVNPIYSDAAVKNFEDIFGVECVRSSIGGCETVGSVCVVTDKGCICHMDASEEEMELIKDLLKVNPVRTTVNHGVDFLASGVIANSKGALVGDQTTPLEMGKIEEGLDLYD